MTLPISSRPSPWHCSSSHLPKPASLLSDATIDPFPQRLTRSASLLEHHIVPGPCEQPVPEAPWRRNTLPVLPPYPDHPDHKAIPPPLPQPLLPPQALLQSKQEECHGIVATKQKASGMAKMDDTETSSLTAPAQAPEINGGYCLCQPEPKIPRPRNAFILYRQHQQATVVRQYPGLPNPEISKIIGDQWSKLPEDQKQRWKALAEEEKARHALQYPDYRYQPRRNGRYSTASAGQTNGQSTGSRAKVDSNGNCIKCGGKTMNPPATPHPPYSPLPRDRDRLRSPPYGGALYDSRDSHSMSYQSPHPRHDHRYHPSYRQSISGPHQPTSAVESYGHDLKRRRFDGAGIYIPTREYRGIPTREYRGEADYAYSPRGPPPPGPPPPPYHRTDMRPREVHVPGSPIVSPRRTHYPPGTTAASPTPILQPVKLPQHRRCDSAVKLPPLASPRSPPQMSANGDGPAKPTQSQESSLAAMIMSIPVLYKIKILSTVSPSLAAPHPASPPLGARGAVVAIDGPDAHSVWAMTNSLKMQLEREGNFVAKIFTGPDPAKFFGISGTESTGPKGAVSTADVLRLAEEWHKVSDEMRRYITTRPGPANDIVAARRTSIRDVDMLEAPETATWSASLERKSSDVTMAEPPSAAKIPDHLPFDHRSVSTTSQAEEVDDGGKSKRHSHSTALSVNSLSKPSGLAITTPSPRVTRSRSTASPSAMSTASAASASRLDTLPPPSPSAPKQPASPTSSSTSATIPRVPAPASPIPVALVPHYQLSTTNYCAIHTAISDAYSPGSHWQWVAALWRGAIGPDVTVAVRPVSIPGSSDEEGSWPFGFADAPLSNSDERMTTTAAAKEKPANTGPVAAARQPQPQPPQAPGQGQGQAQTQAQVQAQANATANGGPSWRTGDAPGVEVRLLDYRAVIVRTMGKGGQRQKNGTHEGGGEGGEGGREKRRESLAQLKLKLSEEEEEEERDMKAEEFWEKAKRRVGFEVAEFLRL